MKFELSNLEKKLLNKLCSGIEKISIYNVLISSLKTFVYSLSFELSLLS